jgi:tryptophan synthase alpha chain
MSRLASCFQTLRTQGRKALITYIAGGDPSAELTVPLMHQLAQSGANILELGIPFSDPMADGPVIQRAAERGIANGVGLRRCLDMVEQFRRTDAVTPVVLMGYANPIEHLGQDVFIQRAAQAGVDGVIVVDYPPEESEDFSRRLQAAGIDMIYLVAPTTTETRMAQVAAHGGGFIYYVSLKGITGAGHLDTRAVAERLPVIRRHSSLPLAVGFGIRDGATARAVAQVADAVVVGSRLIQELENLGPGQDPLAAVHHLVSDIRSAIDQIQPQDSHS